METIGAVVEGDQWGSFYGVYTEEADFMAHLLGDCSNQKELTNFTISSNVYSLDESTNASINLSPSTNLASYYYPGDTNNEVFGCNNSWMSIDYTAIDGKDSIDAIKGDEFVNHDGSNVDGIESNGNVHLGRELAMPMPPPCKEDRVNKLEMSKKRPRIPREVQKNKRSAKQKKVANHDNNDDYKDYSNPMLHKQTSSDCCSEDESNASHEHNGGEASSTSSKGSGKTRASRGSATDPQSLYARKRRERINERLKILQNLVPNGTKVDISTMLEEAVQYVKFLQLQIKLLSSDDLWMYAPLAYNGMDIGLDVKISNSKS